MRNLFLAILLCSFAFSASIKVSTGSKQGNYYIFGSNLAEMLNGLGYKTKVLTTKGSIENIENVLKSKSTVGFVQNDALAHYLSNNPEASNTVEVIGDISKECVYVVAKKDGKVKSEDDLERKDVSIVVGALGSGSEVTWQYITKLDKGFASSTPIYKSGTRALANVANGKYDAFLWVTSPKNLENKFLTTALNNKNLEFIEMDDYSLNNSVKINGKKMQVYNFHDINLAVKEGLIFDSKREYKTICTGMSLIVNSRAKASFLDDLADLVMNKSKTILHTK